MNKVLKIPVEIQGEYYDNDTPEYAVIELATELIKRIKQLNKAVIDLKVYCIEEFDYSPNLRTEDDEDATTVDCCILKVMDDAFQWTGYIKHTSVEWNTERIYLKELS